MNEQEERAEEERLARIEETLEHSIEAAIADGWKMAPVVLVARNARRCCALGALVRDISPGDSGIYVAAFERLGVSGREGMAIIDGFDNPTRRHSAEDEALFNIGARLHHRYIK